MHLHFEVMGMSEDNDITLRREVVGHVHQFELHIFYLEVVGFFVEVEVVIVLHHMCVVVAIDRHIGKAGVFDIRNRIVLAYISRMDDILRTFCDEIVYSLFCKRKLSVCVGNDGYFHTNTRFLGILPKKVISYNNKKKVMGKSVENNKMIFIDIETDRDGKKIYSVGVVCDEKSHKDSSLKAIENFISLCGERRFLCGHNIFAHDLEVLKEHGAVYLERFEIIDTLPVSLLLFNEKTHHALPKVYKDDDDFENDPIKDCQITQTLLTRLLERFEKMESSLQRILYTLLHEQKLFSGFFRYLTQFVAISALELEDLHAMIASKYDATIINRAYLKEMIEKHPVELAYIVALLTPQTELKAHPPKVLYDYPELIEHQKKLCYDVESIFKDLSATSKELFGFGTFREFPRLGNSLFQKNVISQRDIVQAALKGESFLAILPTGGGKTFTFWLPAIIQASKYKSLTVVISPLQALIEDHIKSFEQKVANYKAVAISGFLTPQERAEAIEAVVNGDTDILYIAPESLRSNTIFTILKNRYIERFVVDEAHCLSTWGNDFRQDYYYICDFINDLLKHKPFQKSIPVSCFTATAKPSVIDDIKNYFSDNLSLSLNEYLAKPQRKNLVYEAFMTTKKEKYSKLLALVQEHRGSSLVYIPTSTRLCDEVAEKLQIDTGKSVRSFHSKLDPQEKMEILKGYIDNSIEVIVATTAFGMGVDKPDITQVIHYEPSDSLENYAQEAGRGARDERLQAMCRVLYDESDLDKHFQTLRRSKLTVSEINSVFRVIKSYKGDRLYMSDQELAHAAGWDVEDSALDYKTKIKTVLLELEREGYIKRHRNRVRYFGDSVAADSREKLYRFFEEKSIPKEEQIKYVEVLNRILGRGKDKAIEIDDIAMVLGLERADVATIVQEFKELKIIGDSRDMSLEILQKDAALLDEIFLVERAIYDFLHSRYGELVSIKEINEHLVQSGIINGNESERIETLLKGWRAKGYFSFQRVNRQQNMWRYEFGEGKNFASVLRKRELLVKQLFGALLQLQSLEDEKTIGFALSDLKQSLGGFTYKEIDRSLLFLHRLSIVRLLGGRFIHYAPMHIEKLQKIKITNKRYTKVEYANRMGVHYRIKTEGVHIVGEYIALLLRDPKKAAKFLQDYFTMKYDAFKRRYKLLTKNISRPITKHRYKKLFEALNENQKAIIEDNDSQAIMILAGPGSGKTKVLVHKIASLVLLEDVKPEYFMMLTFSRSAVMEFRSRLEELIGESVYEMEISTFHSFALKLIGRVATEDSDILQEAISEATKQIEESRALIGYKNALVLDEFQDINENAFGMIRALFEANPEMRAVAVGDDDQCIMEYAGANPEYFLKFRTYFQKRQDVEGKAFSEYALLHNYRSSEAVVKYAEAFIEQLSTRLKTASLLAMRPKGEAVEVVEYKGETFVEAAVERVMQLQKSEDCAVLAYTNDEVLRIYSLLRSKGVDAQFLIQRKRFALKQIEEIVYFDAVLTNQAELKGEFSKALFESALQQTQNRFAGSKNLPLLERLLYLFLNDNPNLSFSLWREWIDETNLEDLQQQTKRVVVSTIHKSKGLEFESVVLLANKPIRSDAELRLYYVGMTRAKERLSVLHNDRHHFHLQTPFANYSTMAALPSVDAPLQIVIMGLEDIYLGFAGVQNFKDIHLVAGESLELVQNERYGSLQLLYKNEVVAQLSKKFQQKLKDFFAKGYRIKSIEVDFVVYWQDKENAQTLKHPLAKIELVL